jgi:hypothetical protein
MAGVQEVTSSGHRMVIEIPIDRVELTTPIRRSMPWILALILAGILALISCRLPAHLVGRHFPRSSAIV